ncbi:MAG TPA: ABC transporter ATP-binding protein [Vicinamibacterales bacterium]|nr:ABC transporter ATP-binding protein [Vicinamibacterales bacterium]
MIAFEAFTKRFGAHRAVEDLTLEIRSGEVVALIGPNGSGKTTSLKAAAGLLRPTAGRVLLGSPGRPATDPAARRSMSYMPQRVAFPESLSGREVLEFFRSLRNTDPDRIDQVLRFSSLNGASDRHVGTYSGGMIQRLGLAVAMLPDAPILLLDEPTAALDPDGLCAFYGLVEQRKRAGKAVFFTSHQIGDVERLADRFAVLVEGRLVAALSQAELRDRLAERGVMRLRVGVDPTTLLSSVRTLAPKAVAVGDELIVPGGAALRPRVLDLVRAAGAPIRGLTAEEGRLDTFYRELVSARR